MTGPYRYQVHNLGVICTMLWPTELILGSPLPSLGKKIKHPTCSSLLEDTFLPYCQPQLTGQGAVVQDEPMAFLLLEAASASGQEGMGWAKGYEWTCCLQKDKTKVFSPNWPRETHFLFVWNTYTKNVHVNLKYCSSLQGFQESWWCKSLHNSGLSIVQKVCVPRQACSTA